MENLLLTATSLGIGSYWIGEMLDRQFEVKDLLKVNKDRYDLMAVFLSVVLYEIQNTTQTFVRVRIDI